MEQLHLHRAFNQRQRLLAQMKIETQLEANRAKDPRRILHKTQAM